MNLEEALAKVRELEEKNAKSLMKKRKCSNSLKIKIKKR